MQTLRYFSAFSGTGGFELGIERAFARMLPSTIDASARVARIPALCVGFSEIDRSASAVLRYNFPGIENYGDISRITWSGVPDFDLLVGGSPCQDFSIAGQRAGLDAARSGLAFAYINALKEKQPARFIWENVRGVLSSNRGWDFAALLREMADAGYALWWQVLNARDFGVPQNRERVFVVGFRADLGCPRDIFLERADAPRSRAPREEARQVASTLRCKTTGHDVDQQYIAVPRARSLPLRADFPSRQDGNVYSLDTKVGQVIEHADVIRRLTPLECERLMSWPDHWTQWGRDERGREIEMSDTQRYRMCGNGVVSNVVAALVFRQILERDSD